MSPETPIAISIFAALVAFAIIAVNLSLLMTYVGRKITALGAFTIAILVTSMAIAIFAVSMIISSIVASAFGL